MAGTMAGGGRGANERLWAAVGSQHVAVVVGGPCPMQHLPVILAMRDYLRAERRVGFCRPLAGTCSVRAQDQVGLVEGVNQRELREERIVTDRDTETKVADVEEGAVRPCAPPPEQPRWRRQVQRDIGGVLDRSSGS